MFYHTNKHNICLMDSFSDLQNIRCIGNWTDLKIICYDSQSFEFEFLKLSHFLRIFFSFYVSVFPESIYLFFCYLVCIVMDLVFNLLKLISEAKTGFQKFSEISNVLIEIFYDTPKPSRNL